MPNQQLMVECNPWRVCVAPMLDWTDRHCRYFHRLLSRHTRLYSEMVTTGALRHGQAQRHLQINPEEHPVVLQLGGNEPAELAYAAKLGQQWGYQEINLNCGCPSDRVQRGAFGACLMNDPGTVSDCIKAMIDSVDLPITVKHRIGIGKSESYDFVRDFIGQVREAGCNTFIVHARNAWLEGLSPKENREIPPLRHDWVYRLKGDFPQCTIIINGGVHDNDQIASHLTQVDGVMLGRAAYHQPWLLTEWDGRFWGTPTTHMAQRAAIEEAMVRYMEHAHQQDGCPWYAIARHMLGLYHGQRGARLWRQVWSDHRLKPHSPRQVWQQARQHIEA